MGLLLDIRGIAHVIANHPFSDISKNTLFVRVTEKEEAPSGQQDLRGDGTLSSSQ